MSNGWNIPPILCSRNWATLRSFFTTTFATTYTSSSLFQKLPSMKRLTVQGSNQRISLSSKFFRGLYVLSFEFYKGSCTIQFWRHLPLLTRSDWNSHPISFRHTIARFVHWLHNKLQMDLIAKRRIKKASTVWLTAATNFIWMTLFFIGESQVQRELDTSEGYISRPGRPP